MVAADGLILQRKEGRLARLAPGAGPGILELSERDDGGGGVDTAIPVASEAAGGVDSLDQRRSHRPWWVRSTVSAQLVGFSEAQIASIPLSKGCWLALTWAIMQFTVSLAV